VNPVAFLLGRFGGDVEYLAVEHLALVGNIHADTAAVITSATNNQYAGFGGEAGIRFYPSSTSIFGFFLGASLIAGWYNIDYYGSNLSYGDAGFALDAGGKARVGDSMFISGGGGLQRLYTGRYPSDLAGNVTLVLGPGWAPRLLFTIGWTFR
jgi:hypothetical protein